MEHIVNIAFDFDDKKIKDHIEKTVETQIIDGIKEDIVNSLPSAYSMRERPEDKLRALVSHRIDIFIEDHKDEVFDEVCNRLEKRVARTKRVKEIKGE